MITSDDSLVFACCRWGHLARLCACIAQHEYCRSLQAASRVMDRSKLGITSYIALICMVGDMMSGGLVLLEMAGWGRLFKDIGWLYLLCVMTEEIVHCACINVAMQ